MAVTSACCVDRLVSLATTSTYVACMACTSVTVVAPGHLAIPGQEQHSSASFARFPRYAGMAA